jgi:hypothetical protein
MRCASFALILSLSTSSLPAQVALTLRSATTVAAPASLLLPAYRLELQSAWPQLTSTAMAGCVNGGEEQLTGQLVQTPEGGYAGEFERRTIILFCGVHGQVTEACQLTLRSSGRVEAIGEARVVGTTPLLKLRWRALPDLGAPELLGDCPAEFAGKVQQMYLAVVHGLELPLPVPGEAMRRVMLEDYGWVADIQGEDH